MPFLKKSILITAAAFLHWKDFPGIKIKNKLLNVSFFYPSLSNYPLGLLEFTNNRAQLHLERILNAH